MRVLTILLALSAFLGVAPVAGALEVGFNGDYELTRQWADPTGFQPWINADAAAQRAAGATIERSPLYWRSVEPVQGRRTWTAYDRIVTAAYFQGMRPIFLVSGAPDWASPGCNPTCVPDDAHLPDFANFVQAIVERYGSLIAGVEIYNEPNRAWYWGSASDPERYARVLCAGFRGERAAEAAGSPHVPVAGGAVSGHQTATEGNLTMSDFLRRMFAAGGGACMDALSFHASSGDGDLGPGSQFATVFDQARAARDAAAPGLRLWVSETSMSLAWPGVTEELRADTLPRILRAVAGMDDVDVLIFHTLVQSSGPLTFGLGSLVAGDDGAPVFVPTPAYTALQAELTAPPPAMTTPDPPAAAATAPAPARSSLPRIDPGGVAHATKPTRKHRHKHRRRHGRRHHRKHRHGKRRGARHGRHRAV